MAINTDPHIHKLIMCGNVFVRQDGKYLMIKRSAEKTFAPGVVHSIGGKVDAEENPYTAAARELMEETGLRVKNMKLEAVAFEIKPVKDRDENWLVFHFSGDYESGELKECEEGEFIWLLPEEIEQQELFPSLKILIKHIINPNDGTAFLTMKYDENEVGKVMSLEVCEA